MQPFGKILLAATLTFTSIIPSPVQAKEQGDHIFKIETTKSKKHFRHNIQMQLSDANGVPVPGTEFWVTLNVIKEGAKVTLQLPLINFVTGPYANAPYEYPNNPEGALPTLLNGGYLYTAAGFLPENIRPTDIVYRSWLAASNNGQSLPYSFVPGSTYPVPLTGYIISITNAGGLVIQAPGQTANIIPPGPQILMPTDVTYTVQPKVRLKNNRVISTGPTNTTQFANAYDANDGVRDSHRNAAYDGVAAWSWTDNSMVADKTNGIINAVVAIGRINKEGKLKVSPPVQLTTDLAPNVGAWDTAVAINPTNTDNIVVTYELIDYNTFTLPTYRAVSFDGGKTWPENGLTNIQPTGPLGGGDYPGVAADKYGNFWILATNYYTPSFELINQPFLMVSTDGGVTFELVYTLPFPPLGAAYDFPQFCFGGDGEGNYGLHYSADYADANENTFPAIGFIPIYGLGSFGTPSSTYLLTTFENNVTLDSMTASEDGRVWRFSTGAGIEPLATLGTAITAQSTLFKSPGPLDKNYAGPWNFAIINMLDQFLLAPLVGSQPVRGFIHNCPQSNIYDDARQALYQITAGQAPDFSQNMRLYFAISRDNGQTWSNPIDIANTNFANRGFQSMALDPVRGDLYFGWYDGRNDPSYQSLEYYGAVIPAKRLSCLVNSIPLSNPLYDLPSVGIPFTGDRLTINHHPDQEKVKLKKSPRRAIERLVETAALR